MARDADLINERNEKIRASYEVMSAAGYRHLKICEMLGEQYYLTPKTIENIIQNRPEPSDFDPNQLSLFES